MRAAKKERLVGVLMKDGSARRVHLSQAEAMLTKGEAKRYISNTVYRAMALGISVKDPGTRDDGGKLKAQIVAAREKASKKKPKAKEVTHEDGDSDE